VDRNVRQCCWPAAAVLLVCLLVAPARTSFKQICHARSVYSRLLQCPNSALHGARAAHLRQLEVHARAAQTLRPSAPRAPFELGWAAWARGDYAAAVSWFRRTLLLAAEADDDMFGAAGGWALAAALAMGGAGRLVQVAQVAGLVQMASAAGKRLQRWGMAAAINSIVAFARKPLRRLWLPASSLCFLAMPELRHLPSRRRLGRVQRRCATCKHTFVHMLRCSCCRQRWYCSKECQEDGWREHQQYCREASTKGSG
jgi:MYND finger